MVEQNSDWFGDREFAAVTRRRVSHRAEVKELKDRHGIWTDNCPELGWMALSMPACLEALAGYPLTEEERTHPVALLAGYCRLLDEAQLVEDGHATELMAVKACVARLAEKQAVKA